MKINSLSLQFAYKMIICALNPALEVGNYIFGDRHSNKSNKNRTMKKPILPILAVVALATLSLFSFKQNQPMSNFVFNDYEKAWEIVDSLEQQGLPASAIKHVEAILERAKREDNAPQTIKALLYRAKFQAQLEEDGMVKAIQKIEEEIKESTFPVTAVLQSIQADLYQTYTANNQWNLKNRTEIVGSEETDIRTWTYRQLLEKSRTLFLASVADERLKTLDIDQFKAITQPEANAKKLRPTLFDLLAHRAIDYFSNERNTVTEPAYKFYINQEVAFAPAAEFIKATFETKDSSSAKYQTLLLLQEILAFHSTNKELDAFIDADLKRLQFVHQNAVLGNKRALYIKALENLVVTLERQGAHPVIAEVLYKQAEVYQSNGRNYQPNPDQEGKEYLKTAYTLCRTAISKYPDSYGAGRCKNLITNIERKNLDLTVEQVNLPNQPILASLSFRNVEKAHVRIVSIGYDEQKDFRNHNDIIDRLKDKAIVSSQAIDLPQEGDYHSHRVEFDLGELPVGHYGVLVSDNTAFSTKKGAAGYAYLHISNLAFWSKSNAQGQTELTVINRGTGEPMEGVIAELYAREYKANNRRYSYKKVSTIKSNKEGFVLPVKVNDRNFRVKLIKGADVLYLEDGFSNYRNRSYSGPGQTHTHFFLDRAIYRPGQTVHFKGIVIKKEPQGMPAIETDQPVTISFKDTNHQPIEDLQLTTNEFGTITGSFTAPKTGLLGQMSITSSAGGQQYFSVEEYKRPKFEVTFNPIVGSYKLEDTVAITGKALAFAGSSIDNCQVKYRVVRQVRFPWVPYWYFRYNPYQKPPMEIVNGTTTTNEKGEFEIRFAAIPDPSIPADKKPEFTYQIYADVTDITGETQSTETKVSVGYIALSIDLPLAEKINTEEAIPLTIKSQNLAGEFQPATGKIIIESLEIPTQVYKKRYWQKPDTYVLSKSEFTKKFPAFAYKEENERQNWQVGKTVEEIDFNTTQKKQLALPKLKAGTYRLTLTSADKYDSPIELVKYFEVYETSAKKVANNTPDWLLHPTQSFEPGETATITIGSALAPIKVLVEIEKQGTIVDRYWKKIKGVDQIEIPIKETDRGNFHYHVSFAKDNRSYHFSHTILVPWSNKELQIEYATFRDKLLPGQEEEWQIKLTGPKKEKIAAEMVAGMYDASLDQFAANDWSLHIYPTDAYPRSRWQPRGFSANQSRTLSDGWHQDYFQVEDRVYPSLNRFGFGYDYEFFGGRAAGLAASRGRGKSMRKEAVATMAAPMQSGEVEEMAVTSDQVAYDAVTVESANESATPPPPKKGGPAIRKNLKETVFFMPNLKTDKDGNIIIKFKMNEALTRWKFLGLAHTKDLKFATTQKEIVTQKELMVQPNAPRFFREGDVIEFTAKVSNLSDQVMRGSAEIQLLDALTMQPVNELLGIEKASLPFTVAAGQSSPLSWKVKIPVGKVNAITHRVIAKAGNYSDGEESALPVLSNRMLVTESKPLALRGKETKTFRLESLANSKGSASAQPHQYTLEFTSNPAWYAVQALPYLMEYPYDCTEQIFNRFYANTLASTVANAHPQIQQVFKNWQGKDSKALVSNLSKNQELKSALLEETPWVLNAQSEAQQKRNIALLFDLNKMAYEQATALAKIKERQLSNGGFAWFPGGRDSWYVTQYLVEGMGHLKKLNALDIGSESDMEVVLGNAIQYIDARIEESYAELKKRKKVDLKKDHLNNLAIHYLYTRSFFMDIPITANTREAFDYYVSQSEKYWLNKGVYQEGMIGLALNRINTSAVSKDILKSLRERSIKNEELGMYWKQPSGYYWHQLPMETHSIMIELFEEVAQDQEAVNELKIWLLKNKQTNHWKTTKATSAVVYALLMSGNNWLMDQEQVAISMGNGKQYASQISDAQSTPEAGTGYFKTSWNGADISTEMGNIKVSNPNNQPAWGAVYYQYFEDLDKIKTFEETPLTIKKQLFKEVNSDTGPKLTEITQKSPLTPGDKVKVRIEIRVDRSMEYVHLKDTRAAGFEPINVLSGYKWQGGLGYYESTKDASTNFFIDYLPKGTFVFEYPLRVVHKGEFSNGITSMQCMYAPEFSSHSEGIRVEVR